MNRRRLGQSDIEVSEISLGCWTLGGPNWAKGQPIGWAAVDESEAVAAVHTGLDAGVDHFDNADIYGNGVAERMLAKALGPRTSEVTIATKVGWHQGTAHHAYDPLHIRHQCEMSLKNLQRDVIDLYYFHHGDFGPGDALLDDAVAAMRALRDEGKIRLIGLSAYSSDDFCRLAPRVEPDVLQSWAHIIDDQFVREGGPVERLMRERGMTFVAFSPLAQGLLLGRYSAKNPPKFEEGDHRSKNAKFTQENLANLDPKIAALRERFGEDIPALARVSLQYLLASDVVSCVIPGFRNVRQVESNVAAAGKPLGDDDLAFIREVFSD